MYLVDTNVVSELRKPRPDRLVVAWLRRTSDRDLFLSAVTIGELQAGVEKLRLTDADRAAAIEAWVLFGAKLSPLQIAGIAVTIAGVALATRK